MNSVAISIILAIVIMAIGACVQCSEENKKDEHRRNGNESGAVALSYGDGGDGGGGCGGGGGDCGGGGGEC